MIQIKMTLIKSHFAESLIFKNVSSKKFESIPKVLNYLYSYLDSWRPTTLRTQPSSWHRFDKICSAQDIIGGMIKHTWILKTIRSVIENFARSSTGLSPDNPHMMRMKQLTKRHQFVIIEQRLQMKDIFLWVEDCITLIASDCLNASARRNT